ncbi:MAG: gamma-glutamyl-gamma-aminobutyrate hydrolase family protein [Ignavibacteria bacterium]|nr:gamma-glutamyl-gamma-aminobutyrate hydrolase family protein [Ignavibacteria bacterium]
MRLALTVLVIVLQLPVLLYSQATPPLRIAISKGSETVVVNYIKWLKAARADLEIVELAGLSAEQAALSLQNIDGLVLSGGADVDPIRYKRADYRPVCESDVVRDEMEFALIARARELDLPILGVCRGMQILNVAFGGSLIADIPTQYTTTIEHRYNRDKQQDSQHEVEFVSSSYMKSDIIADNGTVNSAHHQCMAELAPTFTASAYSPDGIVEALEWNDTLKASKPFLFAVQWHPERLSYDNPMSLSIAKRFLREVEASKKVR